MYVRPKKHLGQHFLKDNQIAQNIVEALHVNAQNHMVIEIGSGTGVLTDFLFPIYGKNLQCWDIDRESITYLHKRFPAFKTQILRHDFLKANLNEIEGDLAIIGNFPYNISSQIYFKVYENKDRVKECVGMIQKEVASRIASPHGNKVYGILSVLLQTWYDITFLFDVPPDVFDPPPKVVSAVIRLVRNERKSLPVDEALYKRVIKQGFQNRRKTLRNALKPLGLPKELTKGEVFSLRAEQLDVEAFIQLTATIEETQKAAQDVK